MDANSYELEQQLHTLKKQQSETEDMLLMLKREQNEQEWLEEDFARRYESFGKEMKLGILRII